MKNKFIHFIFILIYLAILSGAISTAQETQMTYGQYAITLVQSLDLEYQLPKTATPSDYIFFLQNKGIKFPEKINADTPITGKEKSYLLFQIYKFRNSSEGKKEIDSLGVRNRAIIKEISGKVTIKPEESIDWIPAEIDMKLTQGDTVKTYKDSSIKLQIGSAGIVEIKEDSELQLKTIATASKDNSEKVLIYLAMGKAIVDVRGLNDASTFQTQTPNTIAAVRGTIYTVTVNPKDGQTEIIETIKARK